ncbi:hypothetical protein E2F43_17040 [Seongchinamella unica]|uniref:Uncharacterized protein n=1 Tax=Seongchinamella unica TaxID=2547392 RepID=A0A4R5LP84_9GAMM|nr:hypothetical protein E2F43_17040 [Seongchinamella unica]
MRVLAQHRDQLDTPGMRELHERCLDNFRKLQREQALNSATLAEKRSRDRAQGKLYKRAKAQSAKDKPR